MSPYVYSMSPALCKTISTTYIYGQKYLFQYIFRQKKIKKISFRYSFSVTSCYVLLKNQTFSKENVSENVNSSSTTVD